MTFPTGAGADSPGEHPRDQDAEARAVARERACALVRAAQGGDRAALGRLYELYASFVHGVLLAAGAGDDADDLLHDAFLAAMDKLPELRDPGAFAPWLATIARNAAGMARRRHMRLVPLEDDVASPAPDHAGLDGSTVLAAIRALPPAYRETLVLRLVEGMSGADIAERTGLAPSSVRVNLHRGMAMLRAKLRAAR